MTSKIASNITIVIFVMIAIMSSTITIPLWAAAPEEKGNGNSENSNNNKNSNSNDDNSNNNDDETATEPDSDSEDETAADAAEPNDPTPGVGNNDNPLGQDNPQPGRVGNHDDAQQSSGEGANAGGTVTDPTLCDITTVEGCSTTVDSNCFGKVISERAQDHKEDPDEGTLGSHSRDPVPELEGNETPRQGIGNQDQGHPAAHGAFNSQFEDEDEQNVIDNC